MKKTILNVEGMSCGHCSASVEKALGAVSGVTSVNVDLGAKTATVESDESVAGASLEKAVTDAGYQVVGIQ